MVCADETLVDELIRAVKQCGPNREVLMPVDEGTWLLYVSAYQRHPLRDHGLSPEKDFYILVGADLKLQKESLTGNPVKTFCQLTVEGTGGYSVDIAPWIDTPSWTDRLIPLDLAVARFWLSIYITSSLAETKPCFAWASMNKAGTDKIGWLGTINGRDCVNVMASFADIESVDMFQRRTLEYFHARARDIPCFKQNSNNETTSSLLKYKAEYRILNTSEELDEDYEERSTLGLRIEWQESQAWETFNENNTPTTLEWDPQYDAEMDLEVQLVHGSREVEGYGDEAKHLLQELINLDKLNQMRKGQRATKQWFGSTGTNLGASGRIQSFLQNIIQEGGRPHETVAVSSALHTGPRTDLDFTERLWTFLLGSINQVDLIEALTATVDLLERGHLKPMVHKSNQSQLARLIRDTLRLCLPQLTLTERSELKESISRQFDYWLQQVEDESSPVIELIIEIGLEKLRRDYVHWLVGQQMLRLDQLESFVDTTTSPTDQIRKLHYLHRLVELTHVLRLHLPCFPYEMLRSLVQSVFKFFLQQHQEPASNDQGVSQYEKIKFAFDETLVVKYRLPKYASGKAQLVETLIKSFQPFAYVVSFQNEYGEKIVNSSFTEQPLLRRAGLVGRDTFHDEQTLDGLFHPGKLHMVVSTKRNVL